MQENNGKYMLCVKNAIVRFTITAAELSNNLSNKLHKSNKLLKRAGILAENKNGFGMNELLGIAAAIVIAAFIVIPGLQGITRNIMNKLSDWWDDIADSVFLK
ncbi:MAG: hypothetical protein GYA02_16365 [Clostridiaceae bacterium]|nr:hypothetical protein [Clostridiaceae bacterium]